MREIIGREDTVVVMCGGRGRRLRPHTDSTPKALIEVAGRPILEHILHFYQTKGFCRFVLCLGYGADMVRTHCSRPRPGCQILFSDGGVEASILNRLWLARELLSDRFVVAYCDTFIDLDIEAMLTRHEQSGAEATIVTAKIVNPFGLVAYDGEWVTSFTEKPVFDYFVGCFLMNRTALEWITPEMLDRPDGAGLVDLFAELARSNRLAGFNHDGLNISFNTEPEWRQAERTMGGFYTYREDG